MPTTPKTFEDALTNPPKDVQEFCYVRFEKLGLTSRVYTYTIQDEMIGITIPCRAWDRFGMRRIIDTDNLSKFQGQYQLGTIDPTIQVETEHFNKAEQTYPAKATYYLSLSQIRKLDVELGKLDPILDRVLEEKSLEALTLERLQELEGAKLSGSGLSDWEMKHALALVYADSNNPNPIEFVRSNMSGGGWGIKWRGDVVPEAFRENKNHAKANAISSSEFNDKDLPLIKHKMKQLKKPQQQQQEQMRREAAEEKVGEEKQESQVVKQQDAIAKKVEPSLTAGEEKRPTNEEVMKLYNELVDALQAYNARLKRSSNDWHSLFFESTQNKQKIVGELLSNLLVNEQKTKDVGTMRNKLNGVSNYLQANSEALTQLGDRRAQKTVRLLEWLCSWFGYKPEQTEGKKIADKIGDAVNPIKPPGQRR